MQVDRNVAIARYTDTFLTDVEYVLDDHGRIRCFVSIQSAKQFLQTVLKIREEDLELFLYPEVHKCDECPSVTLDPSVMFQMKDKTLCSECYHSSE